MSEFDFYKLNPKYASVYLPMDGQYQNSSNLQTINSLGTITEALCGDGLTSTTYPTSLLKRGLYFDGGDYIDLNWSQGSALDSTSFTFLCCCQPSAISSGGSWIYEIGSQQTRYALYLNKTSGTVTLGIIDAGTGAFNVLNSNVKYVVGKDSIFAITVDQNGVNIYIDNTSVCNFIGDIRITSFDSNSEALIGAYGTDKISGTYNFRGKMYQAAIYPFALSDEQVKEWGQRAKQMRNI